MEIEIDQNYAAKFQKSKSLTPKVTRTVPVMLA